MIVEVRELRPGNIFTLKLSIASSDSAVVQVAKVWRQSTGKIRVQWRSGLTLPGAKDFSSDQPIELIGGWSRLSCKSAKPRFEKEIWHLFRSPTLTIENSLNINTRENL